MALVKLENVSLSINEKELFSTINLSINSGDRIGVIGDNGCGKSSLLRSIAKILDEHDGNISHARGLRCHYVEQGFPAGWDDSTASEILDNCLQSSTTDKWKAEYVFELLGFPKDYRTLSFGQLSGGWKKMLMIARAVLFEPDLMLLDEPTNHLDNVHIEKLVRLLGDSSVVPTLAVVSHNRDFLDAVTNSTLILHDGRVSHFSSSFSSSRKLFLEKEKASLCARAEAVNEIQKLKKSAQFQRQLGVNNYSDKALQKAKQMERKVKSLELLIPEKPVSRKREITLAIDEFHARNILQIDDLTLLSETGELLLFVKSLQIKRGDRLVISGANGSGKSTLLKSIFKGETCIRVGPSVKVGMLDQELSALPLNLRILDFFASQFELDQQQAINNLASSGFSYVDSQKKIGDLSNGERARLALLILRLSTPNFLLLDEPTNHLDISSQEMLESEIHRLNPAAIIVSHDMRFVENVGTRFYEISNGQLREAG